MTRAEKIVRLIESSIDPAATMEAVAAQLTWQTPMAVALVNGIRRQGDVKTLQARFCTSTPQVIKDNE
jgi:hypothetical protein